MAKQKSIAVGGYVTEVLILKLKPQVEVTMALLSKEFRIKRITHPLVKEAFVHTEHVGFVDHRLMSYGAEGAHAIQHLWTIAVTKCEQLNGAPLPKFLREVDVFGNADKTF